MDVKIRKCVLAEYGISWITNKILYIIKLKMMKLIPKTELFFEKTVDYPEQLDIFSFDIREIQEFICMLPKAEKESLISQADDACNGKILGFSAVKLDYGYPLNWQLNPLTGQKCSAKEKWYNILDFDDKRGDIKTVWEASRFSHFITLARAYLIMEDKKYYMAFSNQLKDWIEKNPYSYGANYKCGQECGLRMINALLAYKVFKDSQLTTDADQENVKELIWRCYKKILSNFFYADKCIKNNHTITELVGMAVGAWCCRDNSRIKYAFSKLNKVIDRQFTRDGGYIQHSFNYERLALQDIEVVLSIERKAGCRLNAQSRDKILKAARLMYQCQDTNGDMPNYGPNDGALAFPVTSCGYRDFRTVTNTVHAIVDGHKIYESGPHEEELLWFGNKGLSEYGTEVPKRQSSSFDEAGLYTLYNRTSWVFIVLNKYRTRPAHMDQLHFDLWIDGENVLCDGGTYSYASSIGKELISNKSHNTVFYDSRNQMNIYGAFLVYNWTRRNWVKHSDKFFCGEMLSKNGYRHCREINIVDYGYIITDKITGIEGKEFKILFHTPCEVKQQENSIALISNGALKCRIKPKLQCTVSEAYRSLYYLKKEKIYCIEMCGTVKNEVEKIVTEIEL